MQKVSMRKLSLLGLVLLAASAVTAAFTPSKDVKQGNDDGSLRANSNSVNGPAVLSCVTDLDGNVACTASTNGEGAITGTTIGSAGESFDEDALNTINNTSQTADVPGDQTSELE